jgi:predicted RNA-binding protein
LYVTGITPTTDLTIRFQSLRLNRPALTENVDRAVSPEHRIVIYRKDAQRRAVVQAYVKPAAQSRREPIENSLRI